MAVFLFAPLEAVTQVFFLNPCVNAPNGGLFRWFVFYNLNKPDNGDKVTDRRRINK